MMRYLQPSSTILFLPNFISNYSNQLILGNTNYFNSKICILALQSDYSLKYMLAYLGKYFVERAIKIGLGIYILHPLFDFGLIIPYITQIYALEGGPFSLAQIFASYIVNLISLFMSKYLPNFSVYS
jgi:hypothetical protein